MWYLGFTLARPAVVALLGIRPSLSLSLLLCKTKKLISVLNISQS